MWRRDPDQNEHSDRAEVRQMAQEGEVTVVGQGARLEGTIVSAGSLRVDGQVKGQINADGDVMLSPQSQVDADIRADNVVVAGRFKGNVVVKGKAELSRGGRVDGNITSKVLVIQEGGIFCGQSNMDQGSSSGQGSQPAASSSAHAGATTAQSATGPNGAETKADTGAAKATSR